MPLAERMRPRSLDELSGEQHLVGPGGFLRRVVTAGRVPSMILWGPPGVGKTTIARALAAEGHAHFETLSATSSGVKDLRRVVGEARDRRSQFGKRTILFVDEIHRFNKAQQDALLPDVEAGVCVLVGATTENPSFEVNAALLSRARVVQLRELAVGDLVQLLRRALEDRERGLGARGLEADDALLGALGRACQGDARRCLNTLELAADLTSDGESLTRETVAAALGRKALRYDKDGEEHYNVVSALIKSMRASDADAAVYWLARMLEAGDELTFVARRLVIFASEDVGNADPQALVVATAAAQSATLVGMPEAVLPLTQATVYLALAPKSNVVIESYFAARKEVREAGALPVPHAIRNAVTRLMKESGYGAGYRYPHRFDEGVDPGHGSHLPEALRDHLPGRRYVRAGTRGWEGEAEAALAERQTDGSAKDDP